MKTMMKIATMLASLLCAAQVYAQTTTVTATVTDSQGVAWINAPYTVIWAGQGKPSTTSGQSFTLKYSGTTNSSGALSVAGVTDVNYIAPPGSQWNVCITSATSSPATYCIAASITGTSMSLSTQLSAAVTPPSITGGAQTWAYADSEVSAFAGNQYYRTSDGNFRCYASSWGFCSFDSVTPYLSVGPTVSQTNYPNTLASFVGTSGANDYVQIISQDLNPNGSSAYIIGGDNMTNLTHYGNVAFNGSGSSRSSTNVYFTNANAFDEYTTDAEYDFGVGLVTGSGVYNWYVNGYTTPSMTLNSSGLTLKTGIVSGGTTFVVTSGCSTSATSGGILAGSFTASSSTCSPVITPGVTAPHGFACSVTDMTTLLGTIRETAYTQTTVTFSGATLGSTDQFVFNCTEF